MNQTISEHECNAMRELYKGEYAQSELAFLFECTDQTIIEHVNEDCQHDRLTEPDDLDSIQTYTDTQLLSAYRIVHEKQPYRKMSSRVYREYKPDDFPARSTIQDRFGSWLEAREVAHE